MRFNNIGNEISVMIINLHMVEKQYNHELGFWIGLRA